MTALNCDALTNPFGTPQIALLLDSPAAGNDTFRACIFTAPITASRQLSIRRKLSFCLFIVSIEHLDFNSRFYGAHTLSQSYKRCSVHLAFPAVPFISFSPLNHADTSQQTRYNSRSLWSHRASGRYHGRHWPGSSEALRKDGAEEVDLHGEE